MVMMIIPADRTTNQFRVSRFYKGGAENRLFVGCGLIPFIELAHLRDQARG